MEQKWDLHWKKAYQIYLIQIIFLTTYCFFCVRRFYNLNLIISNHPIIGSVNLEAHCVHTRKLRAVICLLFICSLSLRGHAHEQLSSDSAILVGFYRISKGLVSCRRKPSCLQQWQWTLMSILDFPNDSKFMVLWDSFILQNFDKWMIYGCFTCQSDALSELLWSSDLPQSVWSSGYVKLVDIKHLFN